ncbi:MAG: hypothetical protein FJZ01_02080 [Candidatus Sericytochromatia bacterium]|nr:hypothetical protein [Candidatus Tanganyikabacteria bacterium]
MRPFQLGLAGLLVLGVAACRTPAPGGALLRGAGVAGADMPYAHGAAAAVSGEITISVRWPARTAQAIPQSAQSIVVEAYAEGATKPLGNPLQFVRTTGDQSSTVTMTFGRLPVGTYQFVATARDTGGAIVASGTAKAILLPNQRTSVPLSLFGTGQPAISLVGVAAAVPGQKVPVFGRAFGEVANASLSATIGDVQVPGTGIERVTDNLVVLTVPAGAKSGKVKISVAGKEAASILPLSIIARIEATPELAKTHQPAGRAKVTIRAFDAADNEVQAGNLTIRIMSMECEEKDESCLDVCVPGPDFGTFDASDDEVGEQVGTATIRIGSDLLYKTIKVVTHELSPADLADSMGPLPAVPYPADNEPTAARSALGKKLFFDKKLSRAGDMSCATCHDPAKGFADGRERGLGNDGKDLPRHTPTALNAAFMPVQFWDGRAASLEAQALGVIESAKEFNSDKAALVAYVTGEYGADFQGAYGAAPTVDLVTKAIASYERRVLVSGDSPFDKWARGQKDAISDEAKIGLGMFLGKGGCVGCHSGPLFSDGKFHNIGIPGSGTTDLGRGAITSVATDSGAFKTPTLRNVELTAPYMHDGSKATLADAVRFYENFDAAFPNLDPLMVRSNISDEMLAFMKALTSPAATP